MQKRKWVKCLGNELFSKFSDKKSAINMFMGPVKAQSVLDGLEIDKKEVILAPN